MTTTIPGSDLAAFVGRGDIIIESTQRVKGDNSKWTICYRPNPDWVEKASLHEDSKALKERDEVEIISKPRKGPQAIVGRIGMIMGINSDGRTIWVRHCDWNGFMDLNDVRLAQPPANTPQAREQRNRDVGLI